MSDANNLTAVLQDCQQFPSLFRTLHLATLGKDNHPEASYAPYVEENGLYYIFISELSQHTQNLLRHPQCSVLFIESEEQAQHLFARKRLTLRCFGQEIGRNAAQFEPILDLFEHKFGKFMQAIRCLTDFHLFSLAPSKASFVAGFAKAYTLEGADLSQIHYRNEQGHQQTPAISADSIGD